MATTNIFDVDYDELDRTLRSYCYINSNVATLVRDRLVHMLDQVAQGNYSVLSWSYLRGSGRQADIGLRTIETLKAHFRMPTAAEYEATDFDILSLDENVPVEDACDEGTGEEAAQLQGLLKAASAAKEAAQAEARRLSDRIAELQAIMQCQAAKVSTLERLLERAGQQAVEQSADARLGAIVQAAARALQAAERPGPAQSDAVLEAISEQTKALQGAAHVLQALCSIQAAQRARDIGA